MAVSPLDSWAVLDSGEDYTLPAGSERLTCVVVCAESGSAATDVTVAAILLGGEAGELVDGPQGFVSSSNYLCARLYVWDEVALTGLSGALALAFSFSTGGASNSFALVRTFSGVDQTTHVIASTGTDYERIAADATTELTVSVGMGEDGGYGFYAGIGRSNTMSLSLPTANGWAEALDAAEDAASRAFAGGKALTSAAAESFGLVASSSQSYAVGAWLLGPSGTVVAEADESVLVPRRKWFVQQVVNQH